MAADRIIYKFVELDDVIAATPGANKLVYLTSASAIAMTSLSSFARSLIDDADAATARATLGLGSMATADAGDYNTAATEQGFRTVVRAKYATTTNTSPSGAQTVDGATPSNGDIIFVKNNGDATLLGVYYYNNADNWTRVPGFDTGTITGALVVVQAGTANVGNWYTISGTIDSSLTVTGPLSGSKAIPLGVTSGGTGISAVSSGNVLYATGSNTLAAGSPDTAGLVAKSGTQTGIAGDKTCTGQWTFPSGAQIKSNGAFYTNVDFEITNTVYIGGANSNYAGTYGIRWASGGNAFLAQEDTLLGRAAAAIICITDNNTTGNPGLALQAKSSTTNQVDRYREVTAAIDNTHATRKYRITYSIYDTAAREFMRADASGSVAQIGFFGASAVSQQSIGAAATDAASTQTLANNIRTALINLGLCTT